MNAFRLLQFPLWLGVLAILVGCQSQQEPATQTSSSDSGAAVAGTDTSTVDLVSKTKPPATAGSSSSDTTHSVDPGRPMGVQEALSVLMKGNERFVNGKSIHPHESADYRASLAHEQHPFATVLTCSDSRVTPVLIFDQGIGDLFVIRVAGNVLDDDIVGSIEYAVDHLDARLLVILGHEDCGAVTAAYHSYVAKDLKQREPHEIEALLMRLEPALRDVDRSKTVAQQIAAAVEANVRQAIHALLRRTDVQRAQNEGRVKIVGAIYSVETGEVRILDM